MKNLNPLGLFDDHFLLEIITKLGDPLKKLNEFINWKIFESPINKALKNEDLEYQIIDRASFKSFSELKKSDKVPDSKTFWLFREQLIER